MPPLGQNALPKPIMETETQCGSHGNWNSVGAMETETQCWCHGNWNTMLVPWKLKHNHSLYHAFDTNTITDFIVSLTQSLFHHLFCGNTTDLIMSDSDRNMFTDFIMSLKETWSPTSCVWQKHNHSLHVFDGNNHWLHVFNGNNHWLHVFDGNNHWLHVFDGNSHWLHVFDGRNHWLHMLTLPFGWGFIVKRPRALGSVHTCLYILVLTSLPVQLLL